MSGDGKWAGRVQGLFRASSRFPLGILGHPPLKESLGRSYFESHAKAILMPEKERALQEYPRRCRGFVILAEWITHRNAKEQDSISVGKEK